MDIFHRLIPQKFEDIQIDPLNLERGSEDNHFLLETARRNLETATKLSRPLKVKFQTRRKQPGLLRVVAVVVENAVARC